VAPVGAAPASGSAATGEAILRIADEGAAARLWLRLGAAPLLRRAAGAPVRGFGVAVGRSARVGVPGPVGEGVGFAPAPVPFEAWVAEAAVAVTEPLCPLPRGFERLGA
jgi:hypothetical protein